MIIEYDPEALAVLHVVFHCDATFEKDLRARAAVVDYEGPIPMHRLGLARDAAGGVVVVERAPEPAAIDVEARRADVLAQITAWANMQGFAVSNVPMLYFAKVEAAERAARGESVPALETEARLRGLSLDALVAAIRAKADETLARRLDLEATRVGLVLRARTGDLAELDAIAATLARAEQA